MGFGIIIEGKWLAPRLGKANRGGKANALSHRIVKIACRESYGVAALTIWLGGVDCSRLSPRIEALLRAGVLFGSDSFEHDVDSIYRESVLVAEDSSNRFLIHFTPKKSVVV